MHRAAFQLLPDSPSSGGGVNHDGYSDGLCFRRMFQRACIAGLVGF